MLSEYCTYEIGTVRTSSDVCAGALGSGVACPVFQDLCSVAENMIFLLARVQLLIEIQFGRDTKRFLP